MVIMLVTKDDDSNDDDSDENFDGNTDDDEHGCDEDNVATRIFVVRQPKAMMLLQ